MAKEYGQDYFAFLADEPTRTNAYLAVLSESNGLVGRWTFRDMEIARYSKEILSGKLDYGIKLWRKGK